jgi:hemerythrin-like domain-containing protein
MSAAIDDLKHEHEAILFTLKVMERMIAKIRSGEVLEAGDPPAVLAFLREFADKCHHGKEEGILFPALEAAGVPREGGPIGQMLLEHEEGRGYIRRMAAALSGGGDLPAFAKEAEGYVDLLRRHIEKENAVLFPMGERALGEAALAAIAERFEEHEETVIGAGRHEELHAVLEGFEKRYMT